LWIFKPFLQNGSPVMVDVKLVLPFGAPVDPKEERIQKAFSPVWDRCRLLVGQHADPAGQADACDRAAEIADNLTLDSSLVARRSAYVLCATAKLRNKDAKGALVCADRAVAVIRLGHDDASGMSGAYMVRAQAEMQTGDLSAADADLTTAEDQQRAVLKTPTGRDLSKSYTYALKVLLTFHAQVLTAMGKQVEADAHTAEANRIMIQ
jgi:hypothetical protein